MYKWKKKFIKNIIKLKRKYNIKKDYITFDKEMVSRAVFIGMFIAFIPMPMQMMTVFLISPFIKFNVPIAFAICWITNPITMPFIYFLEYSLGSYILGTPINNNLTFTLDEISQIIMQLYYGAFVLSITTATLSYFGIRSIWKKNK